MKIEEINKLHAMLTSEDEEMMMLGITTSCNLLGPPWSHLPSLANMPSLVGFLVGHLANLAYQGGLKKGHELLNGAEDINNA